MKRVLTAIAAAGMVAAAAPAFAQAWAPINARQAMLDQRIDQGLRNRSLTPAEAARLRAEFNDIDRLEARYRATGGLQGWERTDLDKRFDALSARIRVERADGPAANGWQSIQARQARLDRRIDMGLRNGSLSRREAAKLRAEFNEIARMEARYRATGGLQAWERADLDRRFDRLSAMIRFERADNEYR